MEYLQLWFWIRMPKPKKEEAMSFSKSERQKLQALCTQSGAAYWSLRSLMETSTLPVSKVRHFSHSKTSYSEFTLATRHFESMKAFASLKNDFWCMNLAFVDKLAKEIYGVNYSHVRQDLFHQTMDANGMTAKDSKETVRACSTMITKRTHPRNNCVVKGQKLLEKLTFFVLLEDYKCTLQWLIPWLHLLNLTYNQ